MYGLLKGKKGIIFGALNDQSIAWKVAERCHEEGAEFILSNAPIAMRMGEINALAEKTGSEVIGADATSTEDLVNLFDAAIALKKMLLLPEIYDKYTKNWYFFSIYEQEDQAFWHDCLSELIDIAYTTINELELTNTRQTHKAFQELVIYLIVRAWHGFILRKLPASSRILSTIACREGVDRGGALNGGLLGFLTSKTEQEKWIKAISVMWGRPLLFRARLNEEARAEGFFAISSLLPLERVQSLLLKAFEFGYNKAL